MSLLKRLEGKGSIVKSFVKPSQQVENIWRTVANGSTTNTGKDPQARGHSADSWECLPITNNGRATLRKLCKHYQVKDIRAGSEIAERKETTIMLLVRYIHSQTTCNG